MLSEIIFKNHFSPVTHKTIPIEFFLNSPQYKNANVANLVLAIPLQVDWANEVYNFEM